MWDTTKQYSQPNTQTSIQAHMQDPEQPNRQSSLQPHTHTQVYYIPASATPATLVVPQSEGWRQLNQRNKPQSNSVGTASLIFISGGMNMACYLGFSIITPINATVHLVSSWFIGGIIGAIAGAFACNYIRKKYLMFLASVLVTICGILQVSNSNSYDAILASRYLNGIAVGLVFPMTLVLVGEEMVKPLRGVNAGNVDTMCFSCGIFVQIIFSVTWSNDLETTFSSMQLNGVLNIIYGILAFIMTSICMIESPIFYLCRGDERMAIDCLRRLQIPFAITHDTYAQLEEHKLYLAESKEKTFIESAAYGLPALLKLCFYRSFTALSFSYFINVSFMYSALISTKFQIYPYILYAAARFLGPLIASFTLDSKGRKPTMIIGFFGCTISAFIVGGVFGNKLNLIDFDKMNAVKYILIAFQFLAPLSMASSSVYLSEAFPLALKPYYVAIVFIVEMLVQIIIISYRDLSIDYSHISEYFITLGVLSFVFLAVAIFLMPETKGNSLRECLPKFKKVINFRN